jgi:hypothetical protein
VCSIQIKILSPMQGMPPKWGANHDSMLLQQQENYREMS